MTGDTRSQPSTSDATRCAKCGEPFGRIRITIGGSTYHDGCARNLPLDYAALRAKVDEFYDRALTAEAALQEAYADHRKQKARIDELEKEAGK